MADYLPSYSFALASPVIYSSMVGVMADYLPSPLVTLSVSCSVDLNVLGDNISNMILE